MSGDIENRTTAEDKRLKRMLFSLGDFGLALEACGHLRLEERLRHETEFGHFRTRCIETTLIMAYTRPFTTSRGSIPKLSLKATGVKLSGAQRALHDEIVTARNTVIAHSDEEAMWMQVSLVEVAPEAGEPLKLFAPYYDEEPRFSGARLTELEELIGSVHTSLFKKLMGIAAVHPERMNILMEPKAKR